MLWTTAAQSVSKNITCTSVRIRGAFEFNIGQSPFPMRWVKQVVAGIGDPGLGIGAATAGITDPGYNVEFAGGCPRSSWPETAATTSSTLTAFMQRKSMGHSRRKHGLHST